MSFHHVARTTYLFQLSLTVLLLYQSVFIYLFREWIPFFQTNFQDSPYFEFLAELYFTGV